MTGARRWAIVAAFSAAFMAAMAAVFAPYVFTELSPLLGRPAQIDPARPKLARGEWVDDYWTVETIAPGVFAIGEPRYYQQNWAYLIVGDRSAVLFDTSSGSRDIAPVVRRLTVLPVMATVSHLHFDHLGGASALGAIALIDLPSTRARVKDGVFTPGRWQWEGRVDGRPEPHVRVVRWLHDGEVLGLGGRTLTVLSTPGHTRESISLWDPAGKRLFTGDYIYPTTLYAFAPGASLSAYQATARRLLAILPLDAVLWTAHCCRAGEDAAAPWLTRGDLADLDRALTEVRAGRTRPTGVYPRRHPVSRQMTLATGLPWNNP